jgi:hypothetical protein
VVPADQADQIAKLFRLFLDIQLRRGGAEFTNMDAFKIRGLISWGMLMQDPNVTHEGIRHLKSIYKVGFYPDGWWREGSPIYQSDLHRGLQSIIQGLLRGYSDPVGFEASGGDSRIDRLDPAVAFGERPQQVEAVLESMTLPDGKLLAIHDSDWRQSSTLPPKASRRSVLHGCFGQATLCTGAAGGQTMATLHWSRSGVHAHWDALNLNLWAKGVEVITETQYQPVPGSDSTRAWHTSTAGHVTVVVDEKCQSNSGSLGRTFRNRAALDNIPGVADWPWRFNGENADDLGKLELCNFDFPEVQLVEASAVPSYQAVVSLSEYSRLIALVRIDDRDSYVLDVFRTRGGSIHDYMMHSALHMPHLAETSVALKSIDGTLHGNIKELRSGQTDKLWLSVFDLGNQLKLYNFFCPAPGTEVFLGNAPAMRRVGSAPFVIARRIGAESVFVVLHYVALAGPPRIRSVDLIQGEDPSDIGVRVGLAERTDTLVSSRNRSRAFELGDGTRVRARFAHFAVAKDPTQSWSYLVDGDLMQTKDWTVEGDTAQIGGITQVLRRDDGAASNAICTDNPVSLGDLSTGQSVLVQLADLATWGFEIEATKPFDGGSEIACRHDPGFSVRDGVVKQLGCPNWGARGLATYRIPGSALVRFDPDGAPKLRATGLAKLSSVSRVPERPN